MGIVFMHMLPGNATDASDGILTLLSGTVIYLTLRHGPTRGYRSGVPVGNERTCLLGPAGLFGSIGVAGDLLALPTPFSPPTREPCSQP
jgi:hypothetical protein